VETSAAAEAPPAAKSPALQEERRPEAADILIAAGDLLVEDGLFDKAVAAYGQAGVAAPENRVADLLAGRGRSADAAEWYARAGNREGVLKAADALFAKGNLKLASDCYALAGMRDGNARTARIVVDCEALFYPFRFSDAFITRLNAGAIDLENRPSEADAEGDAVLRELLRFFQYITRGDAPRLTVEELLLGRAYFRAEAGRVFSPADGHALTGVDRLRGDYLVSRAAMARMAAAILSRWR